MTQRFPGAEMSDIEFLKDFTRDIFNDRAQIVDYMDGLWKLARLRAWEAAALEIPKIVEAEIAARMMCDENIITIEAVVIEH